MTILRVSRFRSLTLTSLMLLPTTVPSAATLDAEFGATFRGVSAVIVGSGADDLNRFGYDDSGVRLLGAEDCQA